MHKVSMMMLPKRSGLFLAVAALIASPVALAQSTDAPSSQDETPPTEATTLDAVQVRGDYIPQPMLETAEVASFVTREDFERTGDDSAADALTRVTGVSVANDKFVFVRGLNERYSSAMMNGSPLPSPEPMQRVVPLDLFPAEVLQGITVQKTYSAKYPGEFGGGVIDMQALTIPRENFLSVKIGGGANSVTTGEKGLTHYGGGDSDIWGYDDGTRKMPAALKDAIASGQRVDLGNFTREDIRRIGRSFENASLNLLQENDNINPDWNVGASAGYTTDLTSDGGRIGFIAVAGFENQWRTKFGTQQEGFFTNTALELDRDYRFLSTQNDARVNVLLGAGVEYGKHAFGLTTLYVHDTSKETRSRAGTDILFSGNEVRDDYTEWFERDLFNHQLTGKHQFGEYDDLTIDWRLAYARARRSVPYEKGIRFEKIDGHWTHDGSRQQNYTRFSHVDDKVVSGAVDVTWRLPITERTVILSGGLSYSDNDRTAESREFRFLALDGALPFLNRYQRPDFLFSDYNLSQDLLRLRETTGGFGSAAYDATLKVRAAYLQGEIEFNPTLRSTVGVRYEDATQAVMPYDIFSGTPETGVRPLENDYALPSATLTWNFAENQQIRFGLSQTIARPQFREMAPQQYTDPDSDRLFYGNPYLQDSELMNADVRYEWFFRPGEHVTAGLFYKQIDNPIEANINEAGGTIFQSFLNAPEARLLGLELEAKTYLGSPFAWSWLGAENRLFLSGNYTWSDSEIKAGAGDTVHPYGYATPVDALLFVRDGAPMQGQSEHIANLQFGIESPDSGSQIMLVANHVSDRISARGRPGQPDYQVKPGTQLDLVLRKGFTLGGIDMTVGFSARNLLDTEYREYQTRNGAEVEVNRYDPGVTYSLSLSASF